MTIGGWITLFLSLSFVWGLLIWCYSRILAWHTNIQEDPDLL